MPKLPKLFFKLCRVALGLRQQDLAAIAGMSVTRLSAIERGEREPSPQEVEQITKALNLPSEKVDALEKLLSPKQKAT